MSDTFAALPGFYRLLFLYLEPLSTAIPALVVWMAPGANWFYHEQIPSSAPVAVSSDGRSLMILSQLVNCYLLLSLLSSIVFRAVRDTLRDNPAGQERILGASFLALAIADVTHILATFIHLPESLRYDPRSWNGTTHGNITVTLFLFLARISWFLGVGRTRFYFGQRRMDRTKSD